MRRLNRLSITVASIALASSCLAPTSGSPTTSAPSPQARQLVTQVYDVRDILQWLAPPTTQPADRASAMAHLEKIVADACGDDVWHEFGGSVTELPSSGQLVVRQTELNQKRIENSLNSLRHSGQARMINISMHVLSLSDSAMADLPDSVRHQIQQVKSPNVVIAPVSHDEVQSLANRAAATGKLFGVPGITLFSGRSGSLGVNTLVYYIDSLVLSPVTKKYVAHVQSAPSGIRLDVQATVDPTGKVVMTHLNSVLTVLDSLQEAPFIAPDGSYPGDVEIPIIEATKVDCKLAAADGSTYLIAGRFPQRNLPTKLDIVPSFKESLNPSQPFVLLVTCRVLDFQHTMH